MELPIHYPSVSWPLKAKYLDEETPEFARWFIFGEYEGGADVDISDGNRDIMLKVPRGKALAIIGARDGFVDEVLAVLNGTPVT